MLKNIVNVSRGIIISLGILMTSYLPSAYAYDNDCNICLEKCYNTINTESGSSNPGCLADGLNCAANCKRNHGSASCQTQINQFKQKANFLCPKPE